VRHPLRDCSKQVEAWVTGSCHSEANTPEVRVHTTQERLRNAGVVYVSI